MSLINDLLCDLQARNAGQAQSANVADLRPVQRARIRPRRLWLWPVAALLMASSAFAVYQADLREPPLDPVYPEPAAASVTVAAPVTEAPPAEFAPHPPVRRSLRIATRLTTPIVTVPAPARTLPAPRRAAAPAKSVKVASVAATQPAAPPSTAPAKVRTANPRSDGLAALAEGRHEDALQHFGAWIAAAPTDAQARVHEAQVLTALGRDAQAESALSAGLGLVTSPAPVARALARRLLARGETDQALDILEAYRPREQLDTEHDAFIAAAAQRLGRHEVAAQRYRSVLAVRPDAADWWVGLAISEEARGRGEVALTAYRNARDLGNLDPRLANYAAQRIAAMQGADRS